MGTSPRQLQHAFQEGGEDFRSYLLRVRMEAAERLLTRATNPLPVRVVARRVGYSQPSGLRQAFFRHYGRNPSDFQAEPPSYVGSEIEPSE